jgi:hypothetical protein
MNRPVRSPAQAIGTAKLRDFLEMTFLYDPLREIATYRTILGPNLLSTPICYGAIEDPSVER